MPVHGFFFEMKKNEGLLIDISGTLVVDGVISNKIREWFIRLMDRRVPFLLITNTTIQSRSQVAESLRSSGLSISEDRILNPEHAAFDFLQQKHGNSTLRILLHEAECNWDEFKIDNKYPEFIILGDIGSRFTRNFLDEILRQLLAGSNLIALHKSRFWKDGKHLRIDIGGYIALLEYASAKKALIIGKPSVEYFRIACKKLELPPENVLMIGDDIYSDGIAAKEAGLNSAIVKTGKYREDFDEMANENGIQIFNDLSEINFIN